MLNVTWNPNDCNSNITLSNNNLTATRSTVAVAYYGVRATIGRSKGKWYWELTLNGSTYMVLGVANASSSLSSGTQQFQTGALLYYNGGYKENETTQISYGSSSTTNDVIGVALDLDNKQLEFFKNGVSMGVAFTTELTNLGTPLYPFVKMYTASAFSFTANFGATPFTYPAPNGYAPYNNVYKYLIKDGSNIYAIKPSFYDIVAINNATEQNYLDYGADDLSQLTTAYTSNVKNLTNSSSLDTGTLYRATLDKSLISSSGTMTTDTSGTTPKITYTANSFKPIDKVSNNFDILVYKK